MINLEKSVYLKKETHMSQAQIKVISSGKYIPKETITNKDLEKMVDTNHDWIVSRTGIIKSS